MPIRLFATLLCLTVAAAVSSAQIPTVEPPIVSPPVPIVAPITPLFTETERAAIVAYWNKPERYSATSSNPSAPFQVRLTPEGSEWLLTYQKAIGQGGIPPTAVPGGTGAFAAWDAWITAKIAMDRWTATNRANAANALITGKATVPGPAMPTLPGVIPAELLKACVNPPLFANTVAPLLYTVTFDGESDIFTYPDNVLLPAKFPYYRFARGTVAYGPQLKDLPKNELQKLFKDAGFNKAEANIVGAVSPLEGGFETINTYDTGFVSIGFIQFITWNDGRGSLSEVLERMKHDRPTDFRNDFHNLGIDVNTTDHTLTVVDPATGAELRDLPAVIRVIEDKRLTAVFQRAGRRAAFRIAQIQTAKTHYWPADDMVTVTNHENTTLMGKVSEIVKSEAGMATLFDRKVNRGSIFPRFTDAVGDTAKAHKVTKFGDLAKYEREIIAKMKYRADFLDAAKFPELSKPK